MYTITRSIGFDYGHRVMTHGSKCRNIHGHRGTVEVTCEGVSLHESGEQQDMVLDFGFLKEVMMDVIDASIDHGFIAYVEDDFVMGKFCPFHAGEGRKDWIDNARCIIAEKGFYSPAAADEGMKLYIVDFIPTSERLAEHFFHRLQKPIQERSLGKAKLTNLRFWETPNCYSDYPGFKTGSMAEHSA